MDELAGHEVSMVVPRARLLTRMAPFLCEALGDTGRTLVFQGLGLKSEAARVDGREVCDWEAGKLERAVLEFRSKRHGRGAAR